MKWRSVGRSDGAGATCDGGAGAIRREGGGEVPRVREFQCLPSSAFVGAEILLHATPRRRHASVIQVTAMTAWGCESATSLSSTSGQNCARFANLRACILATCVGRRNSLHSSPAGARPASRPPLPSSLSSRRRSGRPTQLRCEVLSQNKQDLSLSPSLDRRHRKLNEGTYEQEWTMI